MAQHDMNIANQGFPAFRSDLNSALSAIVSNSSGATAPTTTFAYQFWADTANDLLKQRNAANDGWVSILTLSTGEPVTGGIQDKIAEGNSSIEVVDTGTGFVSIIADGVEVARFTSNSLGLGGRGVYNATQALNLDGEGLAIKNDRNGSDNNWSIIRNTATSSESNISFATGGVADAFRLDHNGQMNSYIVGQGTYKDYGCRAWVNFNGTGTVAIRSSGNVSSITDNGTGDYTVNFSTAMPDSNYCVNTTGIVLYDQGSTFGFGVRVTGVSGSPTLKSTSQVRLHSRRESDYDITECNVAIHR